MLTKDDTAGAYQSGNEEHDAQPEYRIEVEDAREGDKCSGHSPDSSRMGTDLPVYVYDGAEQLYTQCRHNDTIHKMGDM